MILEEYFMYNTNRNLYRHLANCQYFFVLEGADSPGNQVLCVANN